MALVLPTSLAAQAFRGSVVDSASTAFLDSTFVELLSPDSQVVAYVMSSNGGRFYVRAPGPGPYRLRLRRLGYAAFVSPTVTLSARDTSIHVRLTPLAIELRGVEVVSAESSEFLRNVGYYERKRSSTGFFMDPDAVTRAATKARQTADVLDGIPGVTVRTTGGSWGLRVPLLTRQMGCESGPRIYLDNMLVNAGGQGFDLNSVNPNDLLAVEVYDSVSEVPLQYGGDQSTCGVLVLWTKR